jgi:hypothetical protein
MRPEPLDTARKQRFPAQSIDAGAPGNSTERHFGQDAADLADLE